MKNINQHPLNQVLYGSPGTGKTYKTLEKAVEICDPEFFATLQNVDEGLDRIALIHRYDELVANKQISFVTFHKSFSYEDFVERMHGHLTEGETEYFVEDGIFKKIAKDASQKILSHVWKLSFVGQDNYKNIEKECFENNYILLRYSDKDYEDGIKDMSYRRIMEFMFLHEMKVGDLVLIPEGLNKIRAIAEIVGDVKPLDMNERETYTIKRNVQWLKIFDEPISCFDLLEKSFHHDALYCLRTDRLKASKFNELLNYKFTEIENRNYVLIIDEMNRGNVANIFGELITLLDPSKRVGKDDARSVILPYSKTQFSVPDNLYIIGTMNVSSAALTQHDLVLRRRFIFEEFLPDYELLKGITIYGVNINEMLKIMNDRIEVLLGRECLIGHSHFLPLKDLKEKEQEEKLAKIFKYSIIPLLQKYFIEDWRRIQWIFNDQHKDFDNQFINLIGEIHKDSLIKLFGNLKDINQIADRRYQINERAFYNSQAYAQILAK